MNTRFVRGILMVVSLLASAAFLAGCDNLEGPRGPAGAAGAPGAAGTPGAAGAPGAAGQDVDPATVANLQAQIDALAAAQNAAASVEPESCAICHGDVGTEEHQDIYDQYTDASTLALTIDNVVSVPSATAGKFDTTVTFTIKQNGVGYVDANGLPSLEQKRFYSVQYDNATRMFTGLQAFPAGTGNVITAVGGGVYTAKATAMAYDMSAVGFNGEMYGYIADNKLDTEGMTLYSDVSNAAKAFGNVTSYVSTANVSGCEKCHGTPYMKHGYRAPADDLGNVPDFAACKVCHYDNRTGGHQDWQVILDNPARWAEVHNGTSPLTAAEKTYYAYTANIMSDVHMSHSMEFPYPQSIKNCATCHAGKMTSVTTDANFTEKVCRTCHPVTGSATYGTDTRALEKIWADKGVASFHELGLVCNDCHKAGNGVGAKTFAQLHTGYDPEIYSDAAGTKYSDTISVSITAASFNATTNKLTIDFSVTPATTTITPTLLVGLYGYDTKHLIVAPHNRDIDTSRNLEWVVGTTHPRFAIVSSGGGAWKVTADLSYWASKITSGVVKRAEIGIMPQLVVGGQTVALNAPSKTFDLAANAFGTQVATVVDVAGCNKCHDALATTFHSANRGGNIQVCKLCHVVSSGGSHLEMQSRSIDSYVHAIHSFQDFDSGDIDFTDAVEAARYELHIEHVFPNFTIKNCESCHVAGTYNVPDQSKSLPSVQSAADTWNVDRNIGAVPSYVNGPAARACGGCHRANWIKEDDAGKLAAWNQHVKTFGYLVENATGVYDTVVTTIMSMF